MKITKHGEYAKENCEVEDFKCDHCGCEFTTDYDEYYVQRGSCFTTSASTTYVYNANVTDIYVCSCPECHRIVTKEKQRLISNPTITLNSSTPSPYMTGTDADPCKNCSTNPKNGGSGICLCTLGGKTKFTCSELTNEND